MSDETNHEKFKNSKISFWRLKLSQFDYEIHDKPRLENIASGKT